MMMLNHKPHLEDNILLFLNGSELKKVASQSTTECMDHKTFTMSVLASLPVYV